MMRTGSLFICLLLPGCSLAQGVFSPGAKEVSVVDCFKGKTFSGHFKADSMRANDVLKGTRMWRAISLSNKQNEVVFSSNSPCVELSLFEIIKFGLLEKKLNAFSSDDFASVATSHLSLQQIKNLLVLRDSMEQMSFDAAGNGQLEKKVTSRYRMSSDIKGYLLKEDWVLNSHSGKTEKHILGLAPLVYDAASGKTRPLFWLYYPEWEELLGLFEAKNFYSHEPLTYRQLFEKRYFVSLISKESNVFDRSVKSYAHGEDASMESERIKERLNQAEQDLFQH